MRSLYFYFSREEEKAQSVHKKSRIKYFQHIFSFVAATIEGSEKILFSNNNEKIFVCTQKSFFAINARCAQNRP